MSNLGHVIRELDEIENETPNTLEHILALKETGRRGLEVGNQIAEFYRAQVSNCGQ